MLDYASYKGYEPVVAFLLRQRPPVDTDCWAKAFALAAKRGRDACVQLLYGAAVAAEEDVQELIDEALLIAAYEHAALIEFLLEKGAQVNTIDRSGGTALHRAASVDALPIIELLCQFSCDLLIKDDDGHTALSIAIKNDKRKAAEMLVFYEVEAATSVKLQDNRWTALHAAAYLGYDHAAFYFLDHGAYMNAQDRDGNTPLHLAMIRGHKALAKMLISRGADGTIQNHAGQTARDLTQGDGDG